MRSSGWQDRELIDLSEVICVMDTNVTFIVVWLLFILQVLNVLQELFLDVQKNPRVGLTGEILTLTIKSVHFSLFALFFLSQKHSSIFTAFLIHVCFSCCFCPKAILFACTACIHSRRVYVLGLNICC